MKIDVKARNRAHEFDAEPGARILHAGLARAVGLPYECGSGTCGTCKARLLNGEVDDRWPEAPGRKYLKQPGEFLMCQCVARGPLSIEVASYVEPLEPGTCVPRATAGVIESATRLTDDVMFLRVALDAPMPFDAGQFVLLQVPGVEGHRGWSMVNHARDARVLDFVVKKKPGGKLSDWLFSAEPSGVRVEIFGPLGRATFYPELDQNILCIAGGSGIAGMMSILERASRANYFADHDGHVFFGVRSARDAFFLDEFSRLRETCGDRLHVTVVFSEEPAPESMRTAYPLLDFDTGFVHEAAGRGMQGRYQGIRAYLAGPAPAVDASVRMLLMARVSTDNIRYDKFS